MFRKKRQFHGLNFDNISSNYNIFMLISGEPQFVSETTEQVHFLEMINEILLYFFILILWIEMFDFK